MTKKNIKMTDDKHKLEEFMKKHEEIFIVRPL